MRVRVLGSSLSAAAVRSSLHIAGVAVSDLGYGFTVEIVDTDNEHPTIDGVDCEFERKMVNRISDCANTPVLLLRPGGIRSDQHIRIGIPVREDNSAIERGIMQAIVQAMTPPEAAPVPIQPPGTPAPKIGWWKAFRRWLAALIYATCLYGQITSPWPIIGSYTTTSLPSAGVRNRVAVVTNAASSSSCTSGGGSTVVLCRDTGLAWEPLGGGGGGGAVSSVFTRTGAVTAQSGDYTAAQVTNAVSTLGSYADPSWLTSIAGSKVSGSISGNAGTATALASNPTDCTVGQYATTIAANGNLTCAQVAYSQVSGTPALAAIATSGSASDLSAGTVASTRGGAGTINGILKANGAGTVSAAVSGTDYVVPSGSISGNAGTATALAANPSDCGINQFATTIAASGDLTCAQVAYSQVSGTPALAAVATSGSASDLGSGTLAAARGGAGTVNGLMKANGTGTVSAAVAGTDYVVPSGSISGNAATATALQTARNINGVAFDGTAPITITANLPSNPAACTPGDFVTDIAADGTLTCATPPGAGGGLTQAQVLARASLRF